MSQFNYGSLMWEIDRQFDNRKAFCDKVGISTTTLYRYQTGESTMTADFIARACEVLSIPVDEIGTYFFMPNVDESKQ